MGVVTKEVKVQARVIPEVRDKTNAVLQARGITMSEFLRIVVTSVADGQLPDDFGIPNKHVMESLLEMADSINGDKPLPTAHSRKELARELNDE